MDDDALYRLARQAQVQRLKARRRAARPTASTDFADVCRLSPRQRQGRHHEMQAARYLATQGLTVLAINLTCRHGELDVVAKDGDNLIFVEVRQRSTSHYGGAAASVNRDKQACLIRTAQYFLPRLCQQYFHGRQPACRFDVICVDGDERQWIRHAFHMQA